MVIVLEGRGGVRKKPGGRETNFEVSSNLISRVPNKASCAWEHNLMRFRMLGKKLIKILKLG